MSDISPPKFAHTDGYTVVTFSSDGNYMVTGGSDSLVRIFHTSKEYRHLEAITLDYHSESILSISTSQDKVLCSDEEGKVLGFTLNQKSNTEIEANPIGTIYRSSLPVWEIKATPNAMQVMISTEEGEVRAISLLDMSELGVAKCHTGPINSVDYDSSGTKMVTLGNDGTVKLWDTSDLDFQCVKTWEKIAPACQPGEAEEQVKIRFQNKGNLIAVPAKSGGVILIDSSTYEEKSKIGENLSSIFRCVSWSPNGLYLATTYDREISIWNTETLSKVSSYTHTEYICTAAWHPFENIMAFSDNLGAIIIWDNAVNLKSSEMGKIHPSEEVRHKSEHNPPNINRITESDLFGDNEDILNSDNKVDDQIDINIANSDGEQDDDHMDDSDDNLNGFIVDDNQMNYPRLKNKSRLKQPESAVPFQPSATPWLGNKCYLAFNTIGTVVSTQVDDSHNSIEIEFFDKSVQRDIRFSDPYKFAMASLSNLGCLFGINSNADKLLLDSQMDKDSNTAQDSSAFILYRAFKGWADRSDWSFKLNSKEYIQCAALSSSGAAVFTSHNYLRIFSIGGIQVWLESIPNNILSCVAKDNLLFSVYQNGPIKGLLVSSSGVRSSYTYDWELRKISNGEKIASGICPVSLNSKITWIGFSDEFLPLVCDSTGILRCLSSHNNKSSYSWIPVFNAKLVSNQRGKQESYWPVGASEKNFIVAIVKGKSLYPSIPKPILSELPLSVPLLHPNISTTIEDQSYLIQSIIVNGKNQMSTAQTTAAANFNNHEEIELDKLLLGSINIACRTDKLVRATDLVMMLHSKESLLAAEKIAVFHKNEVLAQRIMEIRTSSNDGNGDVYEESEGEVEEMPEIQSRSTRFLGSSSRKRNSEKNKAHLSASKKNVDDEDGSIYAAQNPINDDDLGQSNSFTNHKISHNKYPDSLFEDDEDISESQATFDTEKLRSEVKSRNSLTSNSVLDSSRKRTVNSAFNPFAIDSSSSISSKNQSNISQSTFLDSSTNKVKGYGKVKNPFDLKQPLKSQDSAEELLGPHKLNNFAGSSKAAITPKSKKQKTLDLINKAIPQDEQPQPEPIHASED